MTAPLDHLRRAPLEPFLRDSAVRCSGTEPEHRMPSGFRHELLDRVTGSCVEKRGSHSRVAHVALQDGSTVSRSPAMITVSSTGSPVLHARACPQSATPAG